MPTRSARSPLPGADGDPGPSDETRKLHDDEVRRIVEDGYEKAPTLLRANRDRLDRLARRLLEKETLDEEEAYAVAGVERHEDQKVAS